MSEDMSLERLARGINEEIRDSRPRPKIGERWIHKGREVEITGDYFLDPVYGRVSNFWHFRYVLPDGSLGKRGGEYDNNPDIFFRKVD